MSRVGFDSLTREERNVLLFLVWGVVLGSLPWSQWLSEESTPRPSDSIQVVELFPIDLNEAPPELLEQLPGVGPAKAQAIATLREERGSFRRVEELADVRGIGPRTVEKLRPLVNVGNETQDAVELPPRDAGGRTGRRQQRGD